MIISTKNAAKITSTNSFGTQNTGKNLTKIVKELGQIQEPVVLHIRQIPL